MRIAINTIGYAPGSGGVETYLSGLITALQKVDSENEYLILCDDLAARDFATVSDRFRILVLRYRQYSCRWILRGLLQRTFGFDLLQRELSHLPVDIMHHTLTVLNPPGLPYPAVLTFHDMQQEYFPQFFSKQELERRRSSYLPSVMEAKGIITVSEHAKHCLLERYGIDPAKVHVVHSGCGDDCRVRDAASLGDLIQKYGLDRPFMIYPAATWPHKNHSRLLQALQLLSERSAFDGELLLTGARKEAHSALLSEINRSGLTSKVRWLGYIPRIDLLSLYSLARLMVFPSLFEGFGLPVVEAMASGCPVACSNTTSLPEIAGDTVVTFDPTAVEDIARAISALWDSSAMREKYSILGLQRSSLFRWEEAAAKTIAVYQQVFSKRVS